MTFHSEFAAGARAVTPLLPPGATVGLVTGVAGTAVGLPAAQVVAMSLAVYSPTVMLAAFTLLAAGAPGVVLVVTALTVGVRFAMLSLSISPHLVRVPTRWKWLLAYFLWTPTYALSIERYRADPDADRRGYYLGVAVPLWAVFQASLVVGVLFGARVPADWQLRFVVPLAFVALLMRMLGDRPAKVAALTAGLLAVVASDAPLNAGFLLAAVGGTAAALLFDASEVTE